MHCANNSLALVLLSTLSSAFYILSFELMAARTGHIHSRSRDGIVSRGPRAVPPAWREQQRDQAASESRIFRSYETRVSSDSLPAGTKYIMENSEGYVHCKSVSRAVAAKFIVHLVYVRGTIYVENLPPGTTSKDLYVRDSKPFSRSSGYSSN